ncbi:MAG: 30S ribosome-binding factor RbfA [Ignavibacteria bacterium]|nr:30S ribosome-binding factor RbfA [Ignavibacteria bacterium]
MSIRTERVAEEIKHRLNTVMTKDFSDLNAGLITISKVLMSPDLKLAKIYVSFLGNKAPADKIVEKMNLRKPHIRFLLGKQLTLKYIPDLIFYFDDTMEYADKINKLLNEVKKSEEKLHEDLSHEDSLEDKNDSQ